MCTHTHARAKYLKCGMLIWHVSCIFQNIRFPWRGHDWWRLWLWRWMKAGVLERIFPYLMALSILLLHFFSQNNKSHFVGGKGKNPPKNMQQIIFCPKRVYSVCVCFVMMMIGIFYILLPLVVTTGMLQERHTHTT